jgi:predicted alpha/beta-fold hydrolase
MPIINNQTLHPKLVFKNKHFNTLYRYFKTDITIPFKRKRIPTKDNDFLDLDFSQVGSDSIIIAVHGLEGSSDSSYIKTLTHYFNGKNIDVVALNLRSCSGELNKKLASYHSGKTEDLDETIQFILKNYHYKNIFLVGFSLGGNIVLKYMGEYANKIPEQVKKAVGVSVPCDLKGSADTISKLENTFYKKNFLKTLKEKALKKLELHTNHQLDYQKIAKATNFKEFDDAFTAPSNGFKDAEDYWQKCSCNIFLPKITQPTLLITALDDPFLSKSCYSFKTANTNDNFYILATNSGGHVGFCESFNMKNNLWLEKQIEAFIKQ